MIIQQMVSPAGGLKGNGRQKEEWRKEELRKEELRKEELRKE